MYKTEQEWQAALTPEQYAILRQEATEAPFSHPLNSEKREGMFLCAGCGNPLFPSAFKYDSGTGWPSFFDAIPGAIATQKDYRLGVERVEYHCVHCGGHQGHLFPDGPEPTSLRYCNNGAALTFIATK